MRHIILLASTQLIFKWNHDLRNMSRNPVLGIFLKCEEIDKILISQFSTHQQPSVHIHIIEVVVHF